MQWDSQQHFVSSQINCITRYFRVIQFYFAQYWLHRLRVVYTAVLQCHNYCTYYILPM